MSEVSNLLPSNNYVNVTPNDSADVIDGIPFRGILLGSAGDIALRNVHGSTVIISGLVGGVIHPIRSTRVLSTGTTAGDICVFY